MALSRSLLARTSMTFFGGTGEFPAIQPYECGIPALSGLEAQVKRSIAEHVEHGASKIVESTKRFRGEWAPDSNAARTMGPCRCGKEGVVSDQGRTLVVSPHIRGGIDCVDSICNEYVPKIASDLEQGPRKKVLRKALRSVKGNIWIDGSKYDSTLLSRIAANFPGEMLYAVPAAMADDRFPGKKRGVLLLQGNGWQAIVTSTVTQMERPEYEPEVDLETLQPAEKKPSKTLHERIYAVESSIKRDNKGKGQGYAQSCRCGDRTFLTTGQAGFSTKAGPDDPKCESSMFCTLLRQARLSLGSKTVSLTKLRKLAKSNKDSNIFIGENAYSSKRLLQLIDPLGSGRARIGKFEHEALPGHNVLVLEDPNDEWTAFLAPIRTDKVSDEMRETVRSWSRVSEDDLAGSLIGHGAHSRRVMAELDDICRNGGCGRNS